MKTEDRKDRKKGKRQGYVTLCRQNEPNNGGELLDIVKIEIGEHKILLERKV